MLLKIIIHIGLLGILSTLGDDEVISPKDDPCGRIDDWDEYKLPRSGIDVLVGKPHFELTRSYFNAFCCCREKGMRLLSPYYGIDRQNLYEDFVELKILEDNNKQYEVAWTDYHNFGTGTENLYGQDADTQAEPQRCLMLQKYGKSLNLTSRVCASPRPLWHVCRKFNNEPFSRDVDSCFVKGYGCNEKTIRKYAESRSCPPEAKVPPSPKSRCGGFFTAIESCRRGFNYDKCSCNP